MNIKKRGTFASLLIALLIVLYNGGSTIAQIVPNPAYTTVTTNPVTGHTEIRSNYPINGGSAILNRYTQFNLASGQTAQMYLGPQPGATTAINVVSDLSGVPSQILGTLNLRLGNALASPVGGNLIFVDPNGIVVGPAGSINAGSVILSASKQTMFQLQPSADPNNPEFININDPAEDTKLATQNINFLGMWKFNQVANGINVMGNIDARGLGLVIPNQGVLLIGSNVSIGSSANIETVINSKVGIVTSENTDFNPSSTSPQTVLQPTSPLTAGGKIQIDGNLNIPQSNLAMMVNTLDVVNNVVNINGLINASALSAGNGAGGTVYIQMRNPNIVPLAGGVIFDGTGGTPSSPRGHIIAQGTNNGAGGNVVIFAPKIAMNNGGGINVASGASSLQGGTVRMVANTGTAIADISPASTSFIDANVLQSIYTVDSTTPVGSSGAIMVDDNPGSPGFHINDSFMLNANTNIIFYSKGNVNVDNSSIMGVGNIVFYGNDYIINQSTIESNEGLVNIGTSTGTIQISSMSLVQACMNNVNFLRQHPSGIMRLFSDGEIKAGDGTFGTINIGNDMNISNKDLIVLGGSTFGPLAKDYTSSQVIPLTSSTPNLVAQNMILNIAQPAPPPADTPQDEPVASSSDGIVYAAVDNPDAGLASNQKKKEELDKNVQDSVATAINNITIDNPDPTNVELQNSIEDFTINDYDNTNPNTSSVYNDDLNKVDIRNQLNLCKGSKCDNLFNNNTVGGKVVDILIKGYPPENEYTADNNGIKFTAQNHYNPAGLENFLKSIKMIEQQATQADQGNPHANSLFSYKHPSTNTRITKIKQEIQHIERKDTNWKENKNEFENILDEIND